ncbi:PspA/IM30 family protein [Terasakiella sp. A23]|uniref:PspA/IM30 family protein n=1 Tax=Terasakiella sp. FCG-A23 TaxID=3080561 RepID=UPI002954B28C|nr:PspA/IM30 family protein [Terasakiella sp. A23]MDV7340473.1 PspA/IM30 family protein [Terasakiella sp. A23]
MTEGLTSRVGRIISGSLNAILDAVEDAAPEAIMEQSIREVDDAIEEVRAELGKVIAAKHLANKKLSDKNSQHESLTEKIEIALAENREDLAEAAVSHQLDIEAQIPVLEHSISESAEKERELEGYVAALQARKREMQEELKAFREAKIASSVDTAGTATPGTPGGDVSKATKAFERVMERQGNTIAGGMTSPKSAAQLQELEQLTQKNRVNERLAAIKSKLGK